MLDFSAFKFQSISKQPDMCCARIEAPEAFVLSTTIISDLIWYPPMIQSVIKWWGPIARISTPFLLQVSPGLFNARALFDKSLVSLLQHTR
jgi:hypothetical protein